MKMESRTRHHLTAAERAKIVAAFQRSGQSQRDFALRRGMAPSNIQRWVQRSRRAQPPESQAAWVEVPNLLANGSRQYRLHFPKGLILELSSGFEPGEVRRLAQVVQSL